MGRKKAMVLAGLITSFVMVVVIGLAAAAGWFQAVAPVAATQGGATTANTTVDTATVSGAQSGADAATVAQLQQQVAQDRQELQQAYDQLQAAYNQINQLQSAVQGGPVGRSGRSGFDDDGGSQGGAFFFLPGGD